MEGSGDFVHGKRRDRFRRGDFLFAPAGLPHSFEGFTDNLLLWVIFYGPEGGENPPPRRAEAAVTRAKGGRKKL